MCKAGGFSRRQTRKAHSSKGLFIESLWPPGTVSSTFMYECRKMLPASLPIPVPQWQAPWDAPSHPDPWCLWTHVQQPRKRVLLFPLTWQVIQRNCSPLHSVPWPHTHLRSSLDLSLPQVHTPLAKAMLAAGLEPLLGPNWLMEA